MSDQKREDYARKWLAFRGLDWDAEHRQAEDEKTGEAARYHILDAFEVADFVLTLSAGQRETP